MMDYLAAVVLVEVDRDHLHVGAAEVEVAAEAEVDQGPQDPDEEDHLLGDTGGDQGAAVLVQAALEVDHLLTVEDMVVTEIALEVEEEAPLLVEEMITDATTDHPVDLMVNPIMMPMAQAFMVLQEEEDPTLAVEGNVGAVRKAHLESHSWCETCLPI